MNNANATVRAALRVMARRNIRNARCQALREFLRGANINPNTIEPVDRQRNRAKLLHMEGLSTAIGVNPDATRKLYEAVIGKDDTLPRRFLLKGDTAARAVGRIVAQQPDGNFLFGTGSLVSQHLVITNNHVLPSAALAQRGVIQFGYYETGPDVFPPNRHAFKLDPGKFFYTHEALDFTLVGVEPTSDGARTADYGHLELLAQSGKALIGERVNIVHHAAGRPQAISIRENVVVDTFDHWIHYQADTAQGSSGAAVFNDEWQLVAIHHAAVPTDDEHGVVNEGVRISAIVDDLVGPRA